MAQRDKYSRSQAVASGERFYYSQVLCKRGHRSRRLTSSGSCCECVRITAGTLVRKARKNARSAVYLAENRTAIRERCNLLAQLRRLEKDTSKVQERDRKYYQKYKMRISERNCRPAVREKRYLYTLKNKYGISEEAYASLLDSQKGACAICKEKPMPDVKGGMLQMDHDHKTGVARRLLCRRCNTMTGFVETHLNLLPHVVGYLLNEGSLTAVAAD